MEMQDRSLRHGFYQLHRSFVEKPLSLEQFWPLFGDKANAPKPEKMTKERYEQILKTHGLNKP